MSTRDLGRFLFASTVVELVAPRGASPKRGLQTGPSPGIQGSLPKILGSTTLPLDEIEAAAL